MTAKRSFALDALRGFAILAMVLSAAVPWEGLPDWMYHAQTPPPHHEFCPYLPGITWVDLVFPFFLFSMGAAIPLAFSRRIEQGVSYWKIGYSVLTRGLLLAGFALYVQHTRPYTITPEPTVVTWLVGILAFALLFPVLSRLPNSWSQKRQLGVRIGGWLGVIALLALLRYPEGAGFSVERNDWIMKLLATAAVFGSAVWLVTRRNLLLRLGSLGLLMAIRLSTDAGGWITWLDKKASLSWIFEPRYVQYLFLVIPGTIAGDLILNWMRAPEALTQEPSGWSKRRLGAMIALMVALPMVLLIGLKCRELLPTTLISFALCGLGMWLFSRPLDATERLLKSLYSWGVYWLILGLLFEPYEGGIKKDAPTMSYYFVTAGLALFTLIAFTIAIDIFQKKRWFRLLIDNGQNPMIAYVGNENLVHAVLVLTGLNAVLLRITPTPWLGFLGGVAFTLLVAWVVSQFTRRKIFWRT